MEKRDIRVARNFCSSCVPIIDGEVEASCSAACGDELITVTDLSSWGPAPGIQQGQDVLSVITKSGKCGTSSDDVIGERCLETGACVAVDLQGDLHDLGAAIADHMRSLLSRRNADM